MPTYEYRCNACGREFEYQQRMADPDLTTCEACHEDKLEKLISRTAFQLKGGGWYKDLYSSTKPAEAASGDKVAVAAPATDKPAAKTEGGTSTGGDSGGSSSGATSSPASSPSTGTAATTATTPKAPSSS